VHALRRGDLLADALALDLCDAHAHGVHQGLDDLPAGDILLCSCHSHLGQGLHGLRGWHVRG